MDIFDRIGGEGYEQVVFCHDRDSGLRAVIAIHSTRLGPGLGGTRFYPYPTEAAGVEDVLRLAKGMTYKAAAAGLDLGGGKAVIIGDPAELRSEALMRAYGRFVHSLGGRYLTAEDVGTTQADMDLIRRETPYVTGVSAALGGSGDPSPPTAYGVHRAMQAVAQWLWGGPSLEGRHVVVTGVGKVGYALCAHLHDDGARLTVADVNDVAAERAVRDFGAATAPPEKSHAVDCDIWSPCALGGGINADTVPELRCAAIVGSANNQLADAASAELVDRSGVLYAPDYIVNSGGITNITEELRGYDRDRAYANIDRVFDTTLRVLELAKTEGIPTALAADRLAERRIEELSRVKLIRA